MKFDCVLESPSINSFLDIIVGETEHHGEDFCDTLRSIVGLPAQLRAMCQMVVFSPVRGLL